MDARITDQPELRAVALRHRGPYPLIGQTFARLQPILEANGLIGGDSPLIAIYYDDPATTASQDLRSDAGVLLAPGTALPNGLADVLLAPGRFATARHIGPYDSLPATWSGLKEWFRSQSHSRRDGPSYEIYLNTPADTVPAKLLTDIFIPVT